MPDEMHSAVPAAGPGAVRFLASGDAAMTVEFGDRIDRELSAAVLGLDAVLRGKGVAGIVDLVPSFRSLLVCFDPAITDFARLRDIIEPLLGEKGAELAGRRRWHIPVCYEPDFAPDLADVAGRAGLAEKAVAELHASLDYHVYMLGFLPGVPYLGDLPEQLELPRRKDPRQEVPAGAVAIATRLSLIYSAPSPGGWHLIGNSPVRLFDAAAARPALLAPGDLVRFAPISASEYRAIEARVRAGGYVPESEAA